MVTSTTKVNKKRAARKQKAEGFIQQFQGLEILAEVICWRASKQGDPNKTHSHRDVIDALKKVGLDGSMAPEILPKAAFSRARKELETSRSIHVLSRDTPTTRFQFTAEFLDTKKDEWTFKKEDVIILNEVTGVIDSQSGNVQLVQQAQALLDQYTERRTTSDITNIVQRFFESKTDLIPFREQGGSYIVFTKDKPLVDQMEGFLDALGGKLRRLPIPKGDTKGDANIQDCLSDFARNLIAEHKSAVERFDINTRKDTLDREVERINSTRLRVKGYEMLLEDQRKELAKFLDEQEENLKNKIGGFDKEREKDPTKPGGEKSTKPKLFGHGLAAVLRWMRSQEWSKKQAAKVLAHYGHTSAGNTYNAQFWRWENWRNSNDPVKKKNGEAAKFTEQEEKELHKVFKKVCGSGS